MLHAAMLLDLGADPNTVDKVGFTCLKKANSAPDTMIELLEREADVAAREDCMSVCIAD